MMSAGSTHLLILEQYDSADAFILIAPGFDHYVVTSEAQQQELTVRFTAAFVNQVDPFAEPAPPATLVSGPGRRAV